MDPLQALRKTFSGGVGNVAWTCQLAFDLIQSEKFYKYFYYYCTIKISILMHTIPLSEPYPKKMESRNLGMLGSCSDLSVTYIM